MRQDTARKTMGVLGDLQWELFPHPPYFSYLNPSDYRDPDLQKKYMKSMP